MNHPSYPNTPTYHPNLHSRDDQSGNFVVVSIKIIRVRISIPHLLTLKPLAIASFKSY